MTYINLKNVEVVYPIYEVNSLSIRKNLISKLKGENQSVNFKSIKALNNINLEIKKGDRLGVIGKNGAGKTTLLKTISRIIQPTNGSVEIQGKIFPLFDINMGLQTEATGYENIFIISYILGFSKEMIQNNIEKIIRFSGLESNIFRAVRTYSSGMVVRLASSIIFHCNAEILLIDEFFGSGDKEFMDKASTKINELIQDSGIFIFTSHNMHYIEKYCNKIIELEEGNIISQKEI